MVLRQPSGRRFAKWQSRTVDARALYDLVPGEMPWPEGGGKMRGVSESWLREVDVINVAMGARMFKGEFRTIADAAVGYWCDFSQGVQTTPWSTDLHTLMIGAALFNC